MLSKKIEIKMCPLNIILLTVQKGSLHIIYLLAEQFSLAHSKFFVSKEIFITLKLDIIFNPDHLGASFFPPLLQSCFQVYFYDFSPGCYKIRNSSLWAL